MQQYAPTFDIGARVKDRRLILLGSLVALLAMTAVVLVLALDGGGSTDSVAGPSAVEQTARPDESKTAAAVGAGHQLSTTATRPDESKTAAAITLRRHPLTIPARPDESAVAGAISRAEGSPPVPPTSIKDLRTGP
jgi:hypothetical protein